MCPKCIMSMFKITRQHKYSLVSLSPFHLLQVSRVYPKCVVSIYMKKMVCDAYGSVSGACSSSDRYQMQYFTNIYVSMLQLIADHLHKIYCNYYI